MTVIRRTALFLLLLSLPTCLVSLGCGGQSDKAQNASSSSDEDMQLEPPTVELPENDAGDPQTPADTDEETSDS